MPPDAPVTPPTRARRLGLLLAGATIALGAAGAAWFFRFAGQVQRDPGVVYRDPTTLDNLLKRANEAERAGDRASAIATYRFVAAVGTGKEWAPYGAAAQAGLRRLGAIDTIPGLPR
ncbi:MAG: hypothetical protein DMD73_05310 [Gemmatimonadetes bacterium]|nr:MAG: hypothetical protein DMD73_05310 [Gemmatimonadota bacterium]